MRPSGRKTVRGKKKELGIEMSINQFTVANHNVSGLKRLHKGRQSSKCPRAITQEGKREERQRLRHRETETHTQRHTHTDRDRDFQYCTLYCKAFLVHGRGLF